MFYDNSILPGTKILFDIVSFLFSFTITQFFQVLKLHNKREPCDLGFTITQFFQVLKYKTAQAELIARFTITQFFQVLK